MNENIYQLFLDALDCGIMDSEVVEKQINMTKREKVQKHHPYTINRRADGRFITYAKEEGENRKKISATTEEGLYQKLYDFYFSRKNVITIAQLFPKFLQARIENDGLNIKTAQRDEQHWLKYFQNETIVQTPIAQIKQYQLNDFWDAMITKHHLSKKEYNNIKVIFNKIFLMAVKEEIITDNPMKNLDVTARFRAVRKKDDGSKVYLNSEYDRLQAILKSSMDICAFAIRLQFQLGCRVGELVLLKWDAINLTKKQVYIHTMEEKIVEYDGSTFVDKGRNVVDHVKLDDEAGYRYLYLSDEAIAILATIKETSESEYVFAIGAKRITYNTYDKQLENFCKKADIPFKSSHCIRRTFASRAFNNGMALDSLRKWLGHTSLTTTMGYIYDSNDEAYLRDIVNSI